MFERFTKDARAAVVAAVDEAQTAGQRSVEAEHLLLALAARPELHQLGLDRRQLADALALEERRSLQVVGVSADAYQLAQPTAPARGPKFAASAKVAMQRGARAAAARGDRRFLSRDLLQGVLAAEHGRVPRALDLAGIDVAQLRARI